MASPTSMSSTPCRSSWRSSWSNKLKLPSVYFRTFPGAAGLCTLSICSMASPTSVSSTPCRSSWRSSCTGARRSAACVMVLYSSSVVARLGGLPCSIQWPN